ncbi:MAG: DNA repair protein [Actinobacteria bacterium]|nr:DNA repair protein [Actinomycetota bacterium]
MAASRPQAIHFTGDPEADALLAHEPLALLIGFALDQQVTVQTAFAGPLKLKQRLGTLDAAEIAALPAARVEEACREKPAVHRFPGNMARRVHELCGVVASDFGNRAETVWTEATSAEELERRIRSLPGFGDMKVVALASVLAKRLGVATAGPLVPAHPTLGDVDSPEALAAYQAQKRAHKAALRARTG